VPAAGSPCIYAGETRSQAKPAGLRRINACKQDRGTSATTGWSVAADTYSGFRAGPPPPPPHPTHTGAGVIHDDEEPAELARLPSNIGAAHDGAIQRPAEEGPAAPRRDLAREKSFPRYPRRFSNEVGRRSICILAGVLIARAWPTARGRRIGTKRGKLAGAEEARRTTRCVIWRAAASKAKPSRCNERSARHLISGYCSPTQWRRRSRRVRGAFARTATSARRGSDAAARDSALV